MRFSCTQPRLRPPMGWVLRSSTPAQNNTDPFLSTPPRQEEQTLAVLKMILDAGGDPSIAVTPFGKDVQLPTALLSESGIQTLLSCASHFHVLWLRMRKQSLVMFSHCFWIFTTALRWHN